jgi:uncharacterized damage-inducible protein DinB
MSIAQGLLPELERELQSTRAMLTLLPADQMTFRPHARSMSFAALATHIAMIPHWGAVMMETPEYDVATAPPHDEVANSEEALARHDESGVALTRAVAAADDAAFQTPWTLRAGPQTIFTLPRIVAMRGMILNHLIHHRGQLSVYLRLLDVPLPAIYGPSADSRS